MVGAMPRVRRVREQRSARRVDDAAGDHDDRRSRMPHARPRAGPTTTRHDNPVADDQLAQLALTSSLDAAKSIYGQHYDYTRSRRRAWPPLVPNVKFVPLDQASDDAVGVLAQDRHDVFFVTRSASGRWYCITDNDTDGVSYGTGALVRRDRQQRRVPADQLAAAGTASPRSSGYLLPKSPSMPPGPTAVCLAKSSSIFWKSSLPARSAIARGIAGNA